jgi:hypothetical protein
MLFAPALRSTGPFTIPRPASQSGANSPISAAAWFVGVGFAVGPVRKRDGLELLVLLWKADAANARNPAEVDGHTAFRVCVVGLGKRQQLMQQVAHTRERANGFVQRAPSLDDEASPTGTPAERSPRTALVAPGRATLFSRYWRRMSS